MKIQATWRSSKDFPYLIRRMDENKSNNQTWNLQWNLDKAAPLCLKSPKKKTIKIVRYRTTLQMKMDTSSSESCKGKKNKSTKKWESLEKCQRVATSWFSSISFSSLTSKAFKRTSVWKPWKSPMGLVDESNRFNNQTKEDFIPKNLHGFMLANVNKTTMDHSSKQKMCFFWLISSDIIWYHLISPILKWFESRCMDTFEFCQEIFSEKIKFHFCKSRWCTRRRAWNGHC